ncbi:MAG: hypothetical protein HY922_05145 [Elusimicrobia bacterium]|nr:hypothetical protein [Elusimicrobiota bacterium]
MPVAFLQVMRPFVTNRGQLLVRKSGEGVTRGNLGMLRGVLFDYHKSHASRYPDSLDPLEYGGKKVGPPPKAKIPPHHPDSFVVTYASSPTDLGGWLYNNIEGHPGFGQVAVNCTHTDTKGKAWTSY